jgi:hypothetical protein
MGNGSRRTCSIAGCSGLHVAHGWCSRHYYRWRTAGDPEAPPLVERRGEQCTVEGCSAPVHAKRRCDRHYREAEHLPKCSIEDCERRASVKGLCAGHYSRWYRHGDPLAGRASKVQRVKGTPGRRSRNTGGYIVVHFPEHPNAHPSSGYVAEHVMVMVEKLGRSLRKGETVHHKNGVRDDNQPENLELWRRQPAGQRVTDLVAWAEELLRIYGEEVKRGVL